MFSSFFPKVTFPTEQWRFMQLDYMKTWGLMSCRLISGLMACSDQIGSPFLCCATCGSLTAPSHSYLNPGEDRRSNFTTVEFHVKLCHSKRMFGSPPGSHRLDVNRRWRFTQPTDVLCSSAWEEEKSRGYCSPPFLSLMTIELTGSNFLAHVLPDPLPMLLPFSI